MLPIDDTGSVTQVPSTAEAEISVFGRGTGESTVVHLGGGDWAVIDSFRSPEEREPVGLQYLTALGVDISRQVKILLATHWHWDHVDGFADAVKMCSQATVCISAAMHLKELCVYAGAAAADPKPTKAHKEFFEVMELLMKRGDHPKLSQEQLPLWQAVVKGRQVELRALSPSSATVHDAVAQVAPALLRIVEGITFKNGRHNEVAVAVCLAAGSANALLASDLEKAADDSRGWGAVVAARAPRAPQGTLVKVSHHGSESGQDDRIWENLLKPQPVGILTHFHGGSAHLPVHSQLDVLNERTGALFSTSMTSRITGDAYDRTPLGRAERGAAGLVALPPGNGHVRARADMTARAPWRVACFGDAQRLT